MEQIEAVKRNIIHTSLFLISCFSTLANLRWLHFNAQNSLASMAEKLYLPSSEQLGLQSFPTLIALILVNPRQYMDFEEYQHEIAKSNRGFLVAHFYTVVTGVLKQSFSISAIFSCVDFSSLEFPSSHDCLQVL